MSETGYRFTQVEAVDKLPHPVGYHLLVVLPEVEDTFGSSGIIRSAQMKMEDRVLSMMGQVLSMGDQAYADKSRYSTGPWCDVGDFVMFRPNSGTRFKVAGREYRLLNDDSIEAVVNDPRAISRAN